VLEGLYRNKFQQLFVEPVVLRMAKAQWLTPNILTFSSGALGLFTCCFLATGHSVVAVAVMFMSGYLDVVDGSLARCKKVCSQFGTALDILTDRFVEGAIIIGLFLIDPQSRGLLCLLMLSCILLCISSFLVVGIFSANSSEKSFHYSPGLIERFEAFLFFAAMILIPSKFVLLSSLFCVLVLYTTVVRAKQFYSYSKLQTAV